MNDFRCSLAARERGDQLAGTASEVSTFLVLEESGPWGAEALRDARLPDGFGAQLAEAAAAARIRPLLMRQRTSSESGSLRRLFVCSVRPSGGQIFTATVTDPRSILDLDFAALARGEAAGLDRWQSSVFGVCVHGRHDACCAERGRPVLNALRKTHGDNVWGVSHIGGDRFAGNLLVLPDGLYYGGLDEVSAPEVVAEYRAGRLALDHLRGRSFWPMPIQAAEIALRRARGDDSLAPYPLLARSGPTGLRRYTFEVPGTGEEITVQVRREEGEPTDLTCQATRQNPTIRWHCTIV